jgi:hypothetical protein
MFEQIISPLYQATGLFFFAVLVFRGATKPTIVAPPPPSFFPPPLAPSGSYTSSTLSVVGPRLSIDRLSNDGTLPELCVPASTSNRSMAEDDGDSYTPLSQQCRKCKKAIKRATRHVCGSCHHAFCMACTPYHPHLEVLGKFVVSACGIESKCRCIDCYEGPPLGPPLSSSPPSSSAKLRLRLLRVGGGSSSREPTPVPQQ